MDQGLAAVLGASVGVLGTLGTGVLTYFAARHQIRDQGNLERERTLRAERAAAFTAFLEAVNLADVQLNELTGTIGVLENRPDDIDAWNERYAEVKKLAETLDDISKRQVKVLLVGPEDVSVKTRPLRLALHKEFGWFLVAWSNFRVEPGWLDQVNEHSARRWEAEREFATLAAKELQRLSH